MKVEEVLIHNYKSILSEVAACRLKLEEKVTILIGANESGKTNILESLTKFSHGQFGEADLPYHSLALQGDSERRGYVNRCVNNIMRRPPQR